MNKLVKGAVAGAAGIALLLGGAGSFALWNGSATTAAGAIQSGTLALASNASDNGGVWTNTPNGSTSAAVIDPSTFKAVPGDTLRFTKALDVTAIGDNLSATLSVNPDTIVAAADSAASVALKKALLTGMSVTIPTSPSNFQAGANNTFTVTGTTATQTITVVVTLPFPQTSTIDNTTQTGTVDLSHLAFSLQQR